MCNKVTKILVVSEMSTTRIIEELSKILDSNSLAVCGVDLSEGDDESISFEYAVPKLGDIELPFVEKLKKKKWRRRKSYFGRREY